MSTYRICIDSSLGFGACVDLAPELFQLQAGGLAAPVVSETSNVLALEAVDACPMGAIEVQEVQAA